MEHIGFEKVTVTGGYWYEKQKLLKEKTVWAVYDRFYETGRITTLDCKWKEGEPNKPHHFWGSDVFKWLEGAAYMLSSEENEKLKAAVDDCIKRIESGVSEDGYYNSYYNSVGEKRFSKRSMHELYSLGHFIECAIAIDKYLHDDRLLKIAVKNTELVDRIFRVEDSAAFVTPGHEEIELALYKLYRYLGDEKYLTLMKYFIDMRGNNAKDTANDTYIVQSQSDEPVRNMSDAKGHAVRAVYLYSAMADLANEIGDKELADAVARLFDDIYYRKMYITGGIGSCYIDEKFTNPYDLPNRDAYTETCAALGLALFCGRLYNQKPDARFGDVFERAVYNGMMSGLGLDGESFFYTNPLCIDLGKKNIHRTYQPDTVRRKVFDCSCCPPNLVRMIPSIGGWIYGLDGDRVFVHQFIASRTVIDGKEISVVTDYPRSGKVTVNGGGKKIAVRKPLWCDLYKTDAVCEEKDGYLYFDTDRVTVDFEMKPKFMRANSKIHADNGRVAIMYGPIVYCAEEVDQGCDLYSLFVNTEKGITVGADDFGGFKTLTAGGFKVSEPNRPYYNAEEIKYEETEIKFIPYSCFANRGESNMQVWLPERRK